MSASVAAAARGDDAFEKCRRTALIGYVWPAHGAQQSRSTSPKDKTTVAVAVAAVTAIAVALELQQ